MSEIDGTPCPNVGRLTISQHHAYECTREHVWTPIVSPESPAPHNGPGPLVDAAVLLMLVLAGIAAVALVKLSIQDWKQCRDRTSQNPHNNPRPFLQEKITNTYAPLHKSTPPEGGIS